MFQMAGINGTGSVYAGWPGANGTSANATPQGPATASVQGFGVTADASGAGLGAKATGVLSVGTLALAGLVFIWWSLPR